MGSLYIYNKPSAETGSLSFVQTCTVNGLSDVTSDMTVNSMAPSDSTALLVSFRNLTTMYTQDYITIYFMSVNKFVRLAIQHGKIGNSKYVFKKSV